MRLRARPTATLTAIMVLAGGCFPATTTVTPGVTGRVVDALGEGVPHAVVEVRGKPGYVGPATFSVTADDQGNIARAEVDRWCLYIIPADLFGMTALVQAREGDAASEVKEIHFRPALRPFGFGGRVNVDLGEMMVVPLVAPAAEPVRR